VKTPFADLGQGSCINCGFLCKRSAELGNESCYEATVRDRVDSRLYNEGLVGSDVNTVPWCFVRATNLPRDLGERPTLKAVRNAITKDRDCPNWILYSEYSGPREHFAELKIAQREQDRREFEQRVERDRREFESRMESERRRFDMWLALVVAILALAEVAAAIIQVAHGW
jgi:hypothetical protein